MFERESWRLGVGILGHRWDVKFNIAKVSLQELDLRYPDSKIVCKGIPYTINLKFFGIQVPRRNRRFSIFFFLLEKLEIINRKMRSYKFAQRLYYSPTEK